ncbi:hypothetical protein Verru16b_00357 [Lacunisphaera limnophila]|uniref:Uncharacterized protein n=1 Tax=Lacunisphaera limnophila TaxID=1838286 RepID=A0A1D8AR14_9BACT|nr:hypothetical protein [Lacunisphaera limnophila]AOS43314.1 hypothetical protein Verru16b_00357 [Lacunisphaera limnophila]
MLAATVLTAVALAALLAASDAPFRNPAPAGAEFIFTFRALGGRVEQGGAAPEQDDRPVHMRATAPAGRGRTVVVVSVDVDGLVQQQVYRPKGVKSDGASVGEWRVPLAPGGHRIAVSVARGAAPGAPRQEWTGEVLAVEGKLVVLSFDSATGYRLEP